jgi:hypothetical protein
MLSSRNGHTSRYDPIGPIKTESVSPDERPVIIIGPDGKVFSSADSVVVAPDPSKYSGKMLVFVVGITLVAIVTTLTMAFRQWRSRYEYRATFGTRNVVPIIDQLRPFSPQGVPDEAWQAAIDRTRSMLTAVTTSNLLSLEELQILRVELSSMALRVQSDPRSAIKELAGLWNQMSDRAEFLLRDRGHPHVRPEILPPRPLNSRRIRQMPKDAVHSQFQE